jgi:chloramphenicol 3-O phosphotransferase
MTIIFLNGAGSSGKSQLAKAIQHCSPTPYLTLGIDSFIKMMPEVYFAFGEKAAEGFSFIPRIEDDKPAIACEAGAFGKQIINAMPKVVKVLAESGFNLIIDEVLLSDSTLRLYVEELAEHNVYFIAVNCSLAAMEEREILRGDRAIGLSRDQILKVHTGIREYDFAVDTSTISSFTCARAIVDFIATTPNPTGFKRMTTLFKQIN